MTEVWKQIPEFENLYEISNYGNFKRLGKLPSKPHVQKNGYVYARVCIKGIPKSCRLHKLVLEAFAGPSNGLQARHLNGNKLDNRIENLAWGTAKENSMDKKSHGTLRGAHKGERHHHAKLSDSDVLEIKELLKKGVKRKIIAAQYKIHTSTISNLKFRQQTEGVNYE
jgi:hypothetical protein